MNIPPCSRWALVASLGLLCAGDVWGAEPGRPPRFERDVWPIIAANCTGCHGAKQPKGGLDLRTVASMLRGGESGPALDRSHSEGSLLLERIVEGEMPPGKARKLSAPEVSLIGAWIQGGAQADHPGAIPPPVSTVRDDDRRFWSFRPSRRPAVPTVADRARVRTPIDAFLLSRLEAKGLTFSPDADATTLVRRAYLDVLGLPPTPDEVDAFLADNQSGAFERLVDRLLASPHYGERWGRHWLDVAGYVDTIGFDDQPNSIPLGNGKWLYRDYVIRSFNEDKPYDRFITEQLAGDELHDWRRAKRLAPEMLAALIATGYLRTARDVTDQETGDKPQHYFSVLHDTLEIVGSGLLGLTVHCARCHDHKFDPIPQEDYYRLMALFTPAYNPGAWLPAAPYGPKLKPRALPDISPAEWAEAERHNAAIDRRLSELRGQLGRLRQPHEERLFEARLATLPAPIRADVKAALRAPAEQRTEIQKYLAEKLAASVTVKPEEVAAALDPKAKALAREIEARMAAAESGRRRWGWLQALYDVGPPPSTRLLLRGSEESPGPEVPPGFLRVLCRSDSEALATASATHAGTSGRRTALARWLTSADSPASALLARVMVNRTWERLHGRGIVPTPDNFGAQGQPPTHAELLEWLSDEFIAGGWRIKPLIRRMMVSTAYRQSSHQAPGPSPRGGGDPESVDPGNDLLWRMRLRRLESEAVRDAILSVSGDLNRAEGGPPVWTAARPDGHVVVALDRLVSPAEQYRRSVYLVARRSYNLSLLTVFDQPLVATNCLKRAGSAVPIQSLFMLHDAFLAEQADHFAGRVERSTPAAPERRVDAAFRMALARRPNASEATTCRALLRQQTDLCLAAGKPRADAEHLALVQLCQTLFNTSEFLFVE